MLKLRFFSAKIKTTCGFARGSLSNHLFFFFYCFPFCAIKILLHFYSTLKSVCKKIHIFKNLKFSLSPLVPRLDVTCLSAKIHLDMQFAYIIISRPDGDKKEEKKVSGEKIESFFESQKKDRTHQNLLRKKKILNIIFFLSCNISTIQTFFFFRFSLQLSIFVAMPST